MPFKNSIIISGLVIFCIFCACRFIPDDELDPLKDDPTTIGNFESSKFEGFWQVQNLSPNWNNPPVLDHPPMLYIFKKNTVQIFSGTRDWDNNGELSEMNTGWKATEFMYSDTIIYTYERRNYGEWVKNYYELSTDGKELNLGRYQLEKFDVESWTKKNILGSWYRDLSNNTISMYTFRDNSLVIQAYTDGIPNNDYTHASMNITLTDESFTGRLNFSGYSTQPSLTTCYYYIINDKLLLSNGDILVRYVDPN
jgi:hypothetical protein